MVRYWGYPYDEQAEELTQAVRQNATLVKVIAPESAIYTEIYLLGAEEQAVFNGDFEQWIGGETNAPLGWQTWQVAGDDENGDSATITRSNIDGRDCVQLSAYENGITDGEREATTVAITQEIEFPGTPLVIDIMAEFNSNISEGLVKAIGIHFVAETTIDFRLLRRH
jgi:hypothetical protein